MAKNYLALQMRRIISICLFFSAPMVSFTQGAGDTTVERFNTKAGVVMTERLAILEEPWGMAFLPDGRLLVTEKPGRLRIYSSGSLSDPVSGVPTVEYHAQGGLMDVALDPDFQSNQLVYLYFVERAPVQPANAKDPGDKRFGEYKDTADVVLKGGAVARGRLVGNELRDVKVIWRQTPKTIGRGHFGGRLAFSPDGKLFITSGDRMRFDPAQQLSGNLGKVVRINPDGSIPSDNPFANRAGAQRDIWSIGHRNPLGAAINPATGKLWMNEMGPAHGDELNIPQPGKNYGWPLASNGNNYDGSVIPDHPAKPQFIAPNFYWHPAISPSGMMFYTGSLFKDWNGSVFLGGLSSEALIRLQLDGDKVKSEERIPLHRRIRDMIQAPDGSIWMITDYKNGELLRMTPVNK